MNVQTSDVGPHWKESSTTFPDCEYTHDGEQLQKFQSNINANNMSVTRSFIVCRNNSSYGLLPPFIQFRKQVDINQQNQSNKKV